MEVLVAATILTIVLLGNSQLLLKLREAATAMRLQTFAQTVAQTQLTVLQTVGPFNPANNQVPPALVVGSSTPIRVPLYDDPTSSLVLSGTMTTTITNPPYNSGAGARGLLVTVTYSFRNTTYHVCVSSIRVSDS